MKTIVAGMKWIMLVAGLLTCTMLYAAIAPQAAVARMFGESVDGAMASIVVRNWGVLIGLMGALLIFGALNPQSRRLTLVAAGVSKLAFIALIAAQGERYLAGLGAAVAVDAFMVIAFGVFLLTWRRP